MTSDEPPLIPHEPSFVREMLSLTLDHHHSCSAPEIRYWCDPGLRRIGYICDSCDWNCCLAIAKIAECPPEHRAFMRDGPERMGVWHRVRDEGLDAVFPLPPAFVPVYSTRFEREELV